jgi:hypothetical protein
MKKIKAYLLAFLILSSFYLLSFNFAPKPETVCFYFNPDNHPYCPKAADAVLKIQRAICIVIPGGPANVATYEDPISQPVTKVTKKSIKGLEINYGFWSKNVWRKNTYAELYYWKYGEWPSPTEEAAITDEQAKEWFIERYTSETIFGDYPPEQVGVTTITYGGKTCVTKAQPCYEFWPAYIGWIEWPDGRKCKINDIMDYDLKGTVEVQLEHGCPYCY